MNNGVETQGRIISDPRSPRTALGEPGMAILGINSRATTASAHCIRQWAFPQQLGLLSSV